MDLTIRSEMAEALKKLESKIDERIKKLCDELMGLILDIDHEIYKIKEELKIHGKQKE